MADFTQFVASTPVVIPQIASKTYDKYWLSTLRVEAGDSTKPITLTAVFTPARDAQSTVPVLDDKGKPTGETTTVNFKELCKGVEPKRLVIKDVFGEATKNLEFAATMNAVFEVLKKKATAAGIL